MKKTLIIFFALCCLNLGALAEVFTVQSVQYTQQNISIPYFRYLRYYIIDEKRINLIYKNLSSREEENLLKTLSKEEKKDYKLVKKVQSLINRNAWGEILYNYPDYFPAYVFYYHRCLEQKYYSEAQRNLSKIREMDRYFQIFKEDTINLAMADLYLKNGQFQTALQYYKMFEDKNDDKIFSAIANCYFQLGNNDKAIAYVKKAHNLSYDDVELMYLISQKTNKIPEAHKWAKILTDKKYNFENLMKVQLTAPNDEEKLKYCYQARNTTINPDEITKVNEIITNLEQKKLDKYIQKSGQSARMPQWSDIANRFPPNISDAEKIAKQDEFFAKANLYLTKYSGNQLSQAFNSLGEEYDRYISNSQEKYYQEQQLKAQQALREAKEREILLREQMIEEQRARRYMELRRRMYYMDYMGTPMSPFWY
ncbi:tetratricopeptide repeat protein [bacterium]|nr:tetratricopeptide repeat protein [bacterium]